MRAYAIRPYTYSLKIKRIIPKHILEKFPFNHTASANNSSFAHVRAYAIRPYTCSFRIKRIIPKHILEKFPFNHTASAINPSFAHVRAYAIRPYTCSMKSRHFGGGNDEWELFGEVLLQPDELRKCVLERLLARGKKIIFGDGQVFFLNGIAQVDAIEIGVDDAVGENVFVVALQQVEATAG